MDENRVKDPLGQYHDTQRIARGPVTESEGWISDGWAVAFRVLAVVGLAGLAAYLLITGLFF